jgi:hypothetical protein
MTAKFKDASSLTLNTLEAIDINIPQWVASSEREFPAQQCPAAALVAVAAANCVCDWPERAAGVEEPISNLGVPTFNAAHLSKTFPERYTARPSPAICRGSGHVKHRAKAGVS